MNYRSIFVLAGVVAGVSSFGQFTLFAAETVAGSLGNNTAAYGGVRQYSFADHSDAGTMGAGIANTSLSDPVGLEMWGGSLYVTNRHGNTLGLGSVQEFAFDGTTLSGGATVMTNVSAAHQGFAGVDFAPNGDAFVATVNSGTRRFSDSGSGYQDIGGFATGAVRDVMVSPDGQTVIQSNISGQLLVTDVAAATTTTFGVAGAGSMHQMAMLGGDLYVTSFSTSTVHRVVLDGNFQPISSSIILQVPQALGITFSPDGQEMFVSGHTTGLISRFLFDGSNWNANGTITTGVDMGYLESVPEPGTMAVVGLGLAGLAARRRRRA